MAEDIGLRARLDINEMTRNAGRYNQIVNGLGTETQSVADRIGGALQRIGEIAAGIGLERIIEGMIGNVRELVGEALELDQLTATFNALTDAAGIDAQEAIANLRKETTGLVDDATLFEAGNKFLAIGLADTSEEAGELAGMATKLGVAMGVDARSAMENFTLLLANQSILRLDQMGLSSANVRARMAELTGGTEEAEKQQKKLNKELEKAEADLGGYDDKIADAEETLGLYEEKLRLARLRQEELAEKTGVSEAQTLSANIAVEQAAKRVDDQRQKVLALKNEQVALTKTTETLKKKQDEFTSSSSGMSKEEAFKVAVMEDARRVMESLGDVTDTVAAKTSRIQTVIANTRAEIGQQFIPVWNELLTPLRDFIETFAPRTVDWAGRIADILIERGVPAFADFLDRVTSLGLAGADLIDALLGLKDPSEAVASAGEHLGEFWGPLGAVFDLVVTGVRKARDVIDTVSPVVKKGLDLLSEPLATVRERADEFIDRLADVPGEITSAFREGGIRGAVDAVLFGLLDVGRLQPLWDDARATGTRIVSDLWAGMEERLPWLTDSLESLYGVLSEAGETVRGVFNDAMGAVSDAIQAHDGDVVAALTDLGSNVLGAVQDGIGRMVGYIRTGDWRGDFQQAFRTGIDLAGTLIEMREQVIDRLFELGHAFVSAIGDAFPGLQPAIDGVFHPLLNLGENVLTTLERVKRGFTSTVLEIAQTSAPDLMAILGDVISLVGTVVTEIDKLVETALPGIATAITNLLPGLSEFTGKVADAAEKYLPDVRAALETLFGETLPALTSVISELLGPLGDLADLLLNIASDVLPAAIDAFNEVVTTVQENWPVIEGTLTDGMERTGTAWEEAWDRISGVVDFVIESLGIVIEDGMIAFREVIDFYNNIISLNFRGAWENVKNIIALNMLSVVEVLANAWEKILGIFPEDYSGPLAPLIDSMRRGTDRIQEFIGETREAIKDQESATAEVAENLKKTAEATDDAVRTFGGTTRETNRQIIGDYESLQQLDDEITGTFEDHPGLTPAANQRMHGMGKDASDSVYLGYVEGSAAEGIPEIWAAWGIEFETSVNREDEAREAGEANIEAYHDAVRDDASQLKEDGDEVSENLVDGLVDGVNRRKPQFVGANRDMTDEGVDALEVTRPIHPQQAFLDATTAAWRDALGDVIETVQTSSETTSDRFEDLIAALDTLSNDVMDDLRDLLDQGVAEVKALVNDTFGAVERELPGLIDSVFGLLRRRFLAEQDDLSPVIQRAGEDLGVGFVDGIISGLEDRVPDLLDDMVDLGVDIVAGVWRGIQNRRRQFFDDIAGFFRDLIDAAMEAVGARSPATRMEPLGESLADGATLGFENRASALVEAVTGTLDNLMDRTARRVRDWADEQGDVIGGVVVPGPGPGPIYPPEVDPGEQRDIESIIGAFAGFLEMSLGYVGENIEKAQQRGARVPQSVAADVANVERMVPQFEEMAQRVLQDVVGEVPSGEILRFLEREADTTQSDRAQTDFLRQMLDHEAFVGLRDLRREYHSLDDMIQDLLQATAALVRGAPGGAPRDIPGGTGALVTLGLETSQPELTGMALVREVLEEGSAYRPPEIPLTFGSQVQAPVIDDAIVRDYVAQGAAYQPPETTMSIDVEVNLPEIDWDRIESEVMSEVQDITDRVVHWITAKGVPELWSWLLHEGQERTVEAWERIWVAVQRVTEQQLSEMIRWIRWEGWPVFTAWLTGEATAQVQEQFSQLWMGVGEATTEWWAGFSESWRNRLLEFEVQLQGDFDRIIQTLSRYQRNWQSIGSGYVRGMRSGIRAEMPGLESTITTNMDGIVDALEGYESDWESIGTSYVSGMQTGVDDEAPQLETAVSDLIDGLISDSEETIDEDSPSLGSALLSGFLDGIDEDKDEFVDDLNDHFTDVIADLKEEQLPEFKKLGGDLGDAVWHNYRAHMMLIVDFTRETIRETLAYAQALIQNWIMEQTQRIEDVLSRIEDDDDRNLPGGRIVAGSTSPVMTAIGSPAPAVAIPGLTEQTIRYELDGGGGGNGGVGINFTGDIYVGSETDMAVFESRVRRVVRDTLRSR